MAAYSPSPNSCIFGTSPYLPLPSTLLHSQSSINEVIYLNTSHPETHDMRASSVFFCTCHQNAIDLLMWNGTADGLHTDSASLRYAAVC